MKKTTFTAVLVYLFTNFVYCQKTSITPILGSNISNVNSSMIGGKPVFGFVTGLSSHISLSKRFDFKYELDFETKGYKLLSTYNDTLNTLIFRKNCLVLPLNIRFNFGKRGLIFLNLGSYLSYTLNYKYKLTSKNSTFEQTSKATYPLNLGVTASAGLRIPVSKYNRILVELRSCLDFYNGKTFAFAAYELLWGYEFGLIRKNSQK